MKKLKCPNCYKAMTLEKKDIHYKKEKYDKWGCRDCTHIIVLDWRE